MLTAVESDQRLTLLLGGLFIDDRACRTPLPSWIAPGHQ
jgi:hypothetical protein